MDISRFMALYKCSYYYYKLKQWFPFLENTPTIEGEDEEADDDKPATGKTSCHCTKTYI